MKKVVLVRFKEAGKQYYFDPNVVTYDQYDKVIVETVRGIELGEVVKVNVEINNKDIINSLKPVMRKAAKNDVSRYEKNVKDALEKLPIIKSYIIKNKLDMKLLGCDYTLDRSKLVIYFNSEGRVDFRELVKDLANEFRVRIELRQVGTRDGAKFLGGLGPCGKLLCCNTFLADFDIVTIKMAKNQNLSLNPVNISGVCGKLLCCIRYENDTYTEYRKELPKLGSFVITKNDGKAKVLSINIITKTLRVETETEGIINLDLSDVTKIYHYDS